MPTDKELLAAAREHIEALENEMQRLMSPPFTIATVLKLMDEKLVLVSAGGGPAIVALPEKVKKSAVKPGVLMTLNPMGALVEVIETPLPGFEATVRRVLDNEMIEIDAGSGAAIVFAGKTERPLKVGDVVLLDRSGQVVLKLVPKDNTAHSVDSATGVTWADIGGQDVAISILREAIEGPIKQAKLYQAYGKKPLKGALLFGPPGNGKTMIAKATTNAIRELHGAKEAFTGFIYVKGPEVLDKWVGNTEAQIRGLFARAKEHKEEHGYPAVIFIDEADAILGKRGSNHGSVLGSTIVPTFLAEMDGIHDSGAFVLLATNRQDALDPAVVREGRIDRKVHVAKPSKEAATNIVKLHLKRTKTDGKVDELATETIVALTQEKHTLYRVGLKGKGVKPFHVAHLVSGAMLAGVVDMATSIAIERDAKAKRTSGSGVNAEDLKLAVDRIAEGQRGLNHEDALQAFADEHCAQIEAIQPVSMAA